MIRRLDSASFPHLSPSETKEINDCWRNFRITRNPWDSFSAKIISIVWLYGDTELITLC